MLNRFAAIFTAVLSLMLGTAHADKPTVTVLAAISLRDAMTDIAHDFESSHDVKVELVFGASGQIEAQIEAGAPADVFVSAADTQVKQLIDKQLVDPASRTLVAHNTLVLIVPASSNSSIASFKDLASAVAKRIAIGEPKSVPAGMYADQVLDHLQMKAAVADKLVYGANVKQVLDYVARGEADAGLVYLTDARAAAKDVRIVAEADESWHEPINYPAVTVRASKQPELAKAFIDFMTSDAGQAALAKRGFAVPRPAGPASQPASAR